MEIDVQDVLRGLRQKIGDDAQTIIAQQLVIDRQAIRITELEAGQPPVVSG